MTQIMRNTVSNHTKDNPRHRGWLQIGALLTLGVSSLTAANNYLVHNLVSDLPGIADHQDKNLVNPWGNGFSGTSPFWIGNNGTGTSTLYDGSGTANAIIVAIPSPAGGSNVGAVTGVMQNPNATSFLVATGKQSQFMFCTEDGVIAGWNSTVDASHAKILVDNSKANAVYKGCALGGTTAAPLLFAANFNSGNIDVWDGNLNPVVRPGSFGNAIVPSGFAPFNIQNIGGKLYVTYAKQDSAKHDDVYGAGNGFVAIYDFNGNLFANLVSQGALNSPWGMAMAPATFGDFGGMFLVSNFGDGRINAFNPTTGALVGTLNDLTSKPISIPGLWSINFGNAGKNTDSNTLYFTAGISGPNGSPVESHGLLGSIQGAPSFTTANVFNGASFSTVIAPNSFVTIKGGELSTITRNWTVADFTSGPPTQLSGVGVTVNGEAAVVSYISPIQINFLVPADIPAGPVTIQVTNNGLQSAKISATVAAVAPSFFTIGAKNGFSYIAAQHADGSPAGPPGLVTGLNTTPYVIGETAVLYGNGFGPTTPPAPPYPSMVLPTPTATIGGIPAKVTFAGLVAAGLYQINVVIPPGLPGTGTNLDEVVVLTMTGGQTQAATAISVVNPNP